MIEPNFLSHSEEASARYDSLVHTTNHFLY